jgi:hypothetical protein
VLDALVYAITIAAKQELLTTEQMLQNHESPIITTSKFHNHAILVIIPSNVHTCMTYYYSIRFP